LIEGKIILTEINSIQLSEAFLSGSHLKADTHRRCKQWLFGFDLRPVLGSSSKYKQVLKGILVN